MTLLRRPYAAARDGLFPTRFVHMSAGGSPVLGLVISSILSTLLVLLNYTKILGRAVRVHHHIGNFDDVIALHIL